jgi:peptide-methionine (R)-S-oxide reductase
VEEGVTTTPTTSISAAQQQQQQQQEFKQRSEAEWRKVLTPQQYYVLRQEGTERPWSSPLNDVKQDGVFVCAGCGSPLFTASKKFEVRTAGPIQP